MYYGQKFDLGNGLSLIFALRVEIGKQHRYFEEWTPPKGIKFLLKNSVLVQKFRNAHEIKVTVADGLGWLNPAQSRNGAQEFYSVDKLNVVVEEPGKKTTFISSYERKDNTRKIRVEKSEEKTEQEVDSEDIAGYQAGVTGKNKKRAHLDRSDLEARRQERKQAAKFREKKVSPKRINGNNHKSSAGCGDSLLDKYPYLKMEVEAVLRKYPSPLR